MSQVLHPVNTKLTLTYLGKQLIFFYSLEYSSNMLSVLLQVLAVNQNVIEENQNKFP